MDDASYLLGTTRKKLLNGTSPASTLSEVKLRGDAAALCLPCAAGFGGSGLRDLTRVYAGVCGCGYRVSGSGMLGV